MKDYLLLIFISFSCFLERLAMVMMGSGDEDGLNN
jgi:hypothetical protein